MKLQPPRLLLDVLRDLRDRRLLIPAVALLASLVAVPTLLSRSAPPPPPPAPEAGTDVAEAIATEPAVLTDEVSVRDYKRRLDQLKSKNPFQEHFTLELTDGGGLAPSGLADEPEPVASSAPTGSVSTTSSGSAGPTGTSSPTPAPPASEPQPPPPEVRYLAYRIDVAVGPVGAVETLDDVPQLKLLPSNDVPVVAFLGVTGNGRKAVFLVSDDVASTSGDGVCFPSAGTCSYLVMGEGDVRTFDFTPDTTTYRLKLRRINEVELKKRSGVSIP